MARVASMLSVLACLAFCGGLISCSGKVEITDEYVVGLAKPQIEANPPPPGFVPVVEWNLHHHADEMFICLIYVPERYVNLREVEGVFLHDAEHPPEYNYDFGKKSDSIPFPYGLKEVPFKDLNTGSWMYVMIIHRSFHTDSKLSSDMKESLASVDDRPGFHSNQRLKIEDIIVDGGEGWFAYAQANTGDVATRAETVDARVSTDAWVLRFTYYGPWGKRSAEEYMEGVEEARQILASFKVLEHVQVR